MEGRERLRVPVGAECADLVAGHVVRIKELWLWEARMQMHYEIWPSVPIVEAQDGHFWRLWGLVRAEDDRGNAYQGLGGAYGPLGDETGRFGSGHWWLTGPPLRAGTLRVTIEPAVDFRATRPCTFAVRLGNEGWPQPSLF